MNCCNNRRPYVTVSTRWGTRVICNGCGAPWVETNAGNKSYEQSEASHTHCWNQTWPPACGNPTKHKICCLCGTPKLEQVVFDVTGWKFKFGQQVKKISGSMWHGKVVGFYTTELNEHGYNVESKYEKGSVQNYPEKALTEDN